jgi:hypothetical protein
MIRLHGTVEHSVWREIHEWKAIDAREALRSVRSEMRKIDVEAHASELCRLRNVYWYHTKQCIIVTSKHQNISHVF